MLVQLNIRNYAIIKEVDILFDNRLNIITGETGAGKSILMGALSLILGERADTKVLMNANDKCVVEGIFNIEGYKLRNFFSANDLDYDHTCIIRREISSAGKSRAFINDTPVNLSLLKELGSQLVDIVSQHQTLELNQEDFQLSIVDAIADTEPLLVIYRRTFQQYRQTEQELRELMESEEKAKSDEDYIRFILNELKEAEIAQNEQEELEKNLDILTNAESIQQSAGNGHRMLDDEEQSIVEQLRSLKSTLSESAKHHSQLSDLVRRIDSCMIELKDVAGEMQNIAENTHADPGELLRIDTRLQLLFSLHKKHRVSGNEGLMQLQEKLQGDLNAIGSLQAEIEEKEKTFRMLKADLVKQAKTLSDTRARAIPGMSRRINELLRQVEMPDARIRIDHTTPDPEAFQRNGTDHISMLFSANPGSSFMPLSKVASGGELSRLMLCIKSLISDKVALPSIVFDEIDTGISGESAVKVSQVMKQHAKLHQVIAITHLPQIAGKADSHFFVYKSSDKKTTSTHIRKLNGPERVEEIARMLHGENPSEKVLEAARELIG